ncbi:hypothetical protein ACFVJH_23340 [Streptomyces decoyicus]|uniref:hypothetical protein n=1 Tax=Streptomyces decoyicus TaxID=249567 RepID=UPI0036309670
MSQPKVLSTTQRSTAMDVVDEFRARRAGECLHLDLYGRVGGMQVLVPANPEAPAAIRSASAFAV